MPRARQRSQPDPSQARNQTEFRDLLRALMTWVGHQTLRELEEGARRRGTVMSISTASSALNTDKLPTAEFVRRFVIACDGDTAGWTAARDTLADRRYAREPDGPLAATTEPEDSPACPFPGLAAFDREQARWFHGREKVTAELLSLLTERMSGRGPLVVVGPSGSGKSSLLRAGLLAAIDDGRLPAPLGPHRLVFTPGADPVRQLAVHLATMSDRPVDTLEADILSDPDMVVSSVLTESEVGIDGPHAVIVVDQFEEAFTLCADVQRRRSFVAAVCGAASSGSGTAPAALVAIGLRADFYGECTDHPQLREALRNGQLPLGVMSGAELRDAIEKPASAAGLELQPGLVDVILVDLGQGTAPDGDPDHLPGALPLLAHALLATWQQLDGRTLTIDGYRLAGGIRGAVANTAERVHSRLDDPGRCVARFVLLRMVELGEGTRITRRGVDRLQLMADSPKPELVGEVIDTLIAARLITAHDNALEIVHEALLSAWPRLQGWIAADRERLTAVRRINTAADEWHSGGRPATDLYRGARLAAAQERIDAADADLSRPARQFLGAAAEQERAEVTSDARRTRRLRIMVAGLSCLVLLAVITTTIAVRTSLDVLHQSGLGLSRQVAASAVALRATDPALAAQVALAALAIADTAEARGAVMSAAVTLDPERWSDTMNADAVQDVTFSQDGSLLVAASRDQIARVWSIGVEPDLAAPPIAYLDHPGHVRTAAFDPGDEVLATSGSDGRVRLWDVASIGERAPVHELVAHPGPLAFSHDGRLLATGGTSERAFRLWDITGPQPRPMPEVLRHDDDVLAVAFSPFDPLLATASADGTVRLWDVRDPGNSRLKAVLQQGGGFVHAVDFSPDGQLLATGHADSAARLWNLAGIAHGEQPAVLTGALGPVSDVHFSPDGRTLATASHDTTSRLWDVSDPRAAVPSALPLAADADNVYSVAYSPNNHTLATASHDRTVHLWETDLDQIVPEICARTATVSSADWERYVPNRPYSPPCPAPVPVDPAPPDSSTTDRVPDSSTITAAHSDKCVVVDGSAVAGSPSYQSGCTDEPGTRWTFEAAAETTPDAYRIVGESGMCLDSSDRERKDGGGTQVVLRPCTDGVESSQVWKIEMLGRGDGRIEVQFRNVRSSDCLNVGRVSTLDGANVIRWPCADPPERNAVFRVDSLPG